MLELLGRSLQEHGERLKIVEEEVLAASAARSDRRHIVAYLNAARRLISAPLRVGIIGEVNSGKTELSNLILGIQVLPTSVVNNTLSPTWIRYGEVPNVRRHLSKTRVDIRDASELHRLVQQQGSLVECLLPLPLLRSVEIVDFPAFEVDQLLSGPLFRLLSRSDVLVWCSSAARAWTATENRVWGQLPESLRRNCVFALTHADKLSDGERKDVELRLTSELVETGLQPIAIAVPSAIEARSPRGQIMDRNLWNVSGGERFMKELVGLLQNALHRRRSRLDESLTGFVSRLASRMARGERSITSEWARLAPYFAPSPARGFSPQEATAAARAVQRFGETKCKSWLRAKGRPEAEIETFLSLLPGQKDLLIPEAEYVSLGFQREIYEQISAEIGDYVEIIEIRNGATL